MWIAVNAFTFEEKRNGSIKHAPNVKKQIVLKTQKEDSVYKDRKLAFHEIGKGRCGIEMQNEFERATLVAADRNVAVKVTLTITVYPPDKDDANYGGISFAIQRSAPPKQSIKYTTLLRNGTLISEGRDRDEALAIQLEFPEDQHENIIPLKAEGGNQ